MFGRALAASFAALVMAAIPGVGAPLDVTSEPIDAPVFCASWAAARSALSNERLDTFDQGLESASDVADEQIATIDEVESTVPAEIRPEWDVAAGHRRAVTDLLFTVGFDPDRVLPVHLELAFGDEDPAVAEAEAIEAIEAIDAWTVTGCGDFCARWPQIEPALRVDERDVDGDPREVRARDAEDAALLEAIGPLVPDAMRASWDEAVAWRSITTEALQADPEGRIDHHLAELGDGIDFGLYLEEMDRLIEPIEAWVVANCEQVGAGAGAPGTLVVQVPIEAQMIGSDLLVAVVPRGTSITGLESNDALLGGNCEPMQDPRPATSSEMWQPAGSSRLCDVLGAGDEPVPATLEGGEYDVVALTLTGLGPGDLSSYLPPPELCTRFAVTVDGDTVVDAPTLGPCTLGPLAGDPADALDRYAPIADRGDPDAGTLRIELPDAVSPVREPEADPSADHAGGALLAVVLPKGTILEDVGRHRVWPSGVTCMRAHTPEFLERLDDRQRADLEGPFPLPVVAFPATGHPPACFVPNGLADQLIDGLGPDPVVLAGGSYDVYLEASIDITSPGGGDQRRCHTMEVELRGDVTLEPPPATEWGACP